MLVFVATVADARTSDGDYRAFTDPMTTEPLNFDGMVLERFNDAVLSPDGNLNDPEIVVVLTEDPADLDGPAGSERMQGAFEDWGRSNGCQVEFVLLPNPSQVPTFFRCISDYMEQLRTRVDQVEVFLGGYDAIADMMAVITALRGLAVPDNVTFRVAYRSLEGGREFVHLDVERYINLELVREHALDRITNWGFHDVATLARLHHELDDVRVELVAATAFLQRNPGALQELGIITDDVPSEWKYTRELAHALELAEYFTSISREEEQTAWYVILALVELLPAAWAEQFLSAQFNHGDPITLVQGIERLEESHPGLLGEGGSVLGRLGIASYGSGPHEAARLLACLGPTVLAMDDVVVTRPDVPATLPVQPVLAVLWMAISIGFRGFRNDMAHLFEDLDEDSLVAELRAARQLALAAMKDLLDVDEDDLVPDEHAFDEQVLRLLDGVPPRPPKPARGRQARRVWQRIVRGEAVEKERTQHADRMRNWLRQAGQPGPGADVYAWFVHDLRGWWPELADELIAEMRRRHRRANLDLSDHPGLRGEIATHLPEGVFVPGHLDEPLQASQLRQLVQGFAPAIGRRDHPLVIARRHVMRALEKPLLDGPLDQDRDGDGSFEDE